jgi:nitrite reductase/ring-hydroxylating ferredoxin subunit
MQSWHEVHEAKGLKSGEMTHGKAGDEDILVLNHGGGFYAYINRCGHMNAPLDLGEFKGAVIKCALHNAVFDARTGEVRGQPIMSRAGMDMSKLPPEFLESMMKMAPIMARVECRPLTPVPVESSGSTVRVWV